MTLISFLKSYLSKINFILGRIPRIEKWGNSGNFIPDGYQSVVLISADFELAWAFRFSKSSKTQFEEPIEHGNRTRKNIPEILKLCEEYKVPITWATVGHLFLNNCKKTEGIPHPEILRLPYFENDFWRYDSGDWFDSDPCTNLEDDPAWYCPDLIKQILECPTEQEIGCHTFSHIDCRDEVCSDEVFKSEIEACKNVAKEFNIEYKSFVHPGHQIGNLNNLAKLGFTNFRTDYGDSLSFPKLHNNGLWELKNSTGIEFRQGWSVRYHIKRIIRIIERAKKYKKICVLWFHPSFNTLVPQQILPEIFKFLNENRDDIWITTHDNYINWLNSNRQSNTG